MQPRISGRERIQIASRAEQAIMKYAKPDPDTGCRPHALWHKHVHNVNLDPMQVLKMMEMDRHKNTLDFSCRRTRKTSVKELYNLERLATGPYHELGIVAPRERQSQNNLLYHLEAIRRSDMLKSYIAYKSGRQQLSETKYEFVNNSVAKIYGIMAQVDGDSLAIASLEEVDDMPADRLFTKFLPMLGATQRLGADVVIEPEIRITGVFKGADTLQRLVDGSNYHVLPIVDAYLGIELGIITEAWRARQASDLPEAEYIRQFLCLNVAARNLIWEIWIRRSMAVGLQAGIELAEPLPGRKYKKRGLITIGYDHTGHGESGTASKSAAVVSEQIGNYVTYPYARTWKPGTDDKDLELDLYSIWDYFMPDAAIGDAYGVGMLTGLNDRLYRGGLTTIDRRTVGNGESNATNWPDWAFAPLRFEGMTKHSMATGLRNIFHNGRAALPYIEEAFPAIDGSTGTIVMPMALNELAGVAGDLALLVRQLGNIKPEKNATSGMRGSYDSYKMADPKIGDDLFDAAMAATWALISRGSELVPGVILSRTQTREQLLGQQLALPQRAAA